MARAAKSESGQARHVALGLTDTQALETHRRMLLARMLDERQWALNRQGKAPFVVSSAGHEACQIGTAMALVPGVDFYVPYYRDLGVVLVAGLTPRDVLLGVYARAEDPCNGGRQMPSHWGSNRLGIISGSSPIATQVPHASGLAYAVKYRREPAVVMCWFGEGATSEGDWHEALNFAGIHQLPVIFVCENNRYAISVPQDKQMAVPHVAQRAAAYGFEGKLVDGNDVLACYEAARAAVDKARAGGGPTLIETPCYRYAPHTSDDDDRTYRSREEVRQARRNDPVSKFQNYLVDQGLLDAAGIEALTEEIKGELAEAIEYVDAAPYPAPEDALRHVFAESISL
ncbi:MAG TPA: thiamine pyrophosphate-dependent dehydrogenase E1 component subunit alpha [Actinomycetota bacterium]|nr:thiamine pyrophosphate-dependent dehydrogenase E1 component subunit alpha [Actinomycetota bacterium]